MYKAKLKNLRVSARKARLVADLIRGKKVEEARAVLKYTFKKSAEPMLKLLDSAVKNAENIDNVKAEDLFISKVIVNEGTTLKRIRPRARGVAYRINKRTCHIEIELDKLVKYKKMSHKVHPKIFRVKETNDWLSRGFYEKDFKKLLKEDFVIREFLNEKLKTFSVEKIEINRLPNKTNVVIFTSRPGLVIGRGGEGIEKLIKELYKAISKQMRLTQKERLSLEKRLKLEVKEVRNPWTSAKLTAEWIAERIERRMPFRRTIKQAVEKTMANKEIKGMKVEIAGRLDGVQIARKEKVSAGRLPRNTIRADIDYSAHSAFCTYGKIGIKVWLYKGEKFDK